jgi:hypothetical protein
MFFEGRQARTEQLLEAERAETDAVDSSAALARPAPKVQKQEAPRAPEPDGPPTGEEGPDDRDVSDGEANVSFALGEAFRTDAPGSRVAYERTRTFHELFAAADLGDKASLTSFECKAELCRGEIEISNGLDDHAVFSSTLLSSAFASAFPMAVTVHSREVRPDQSVLAKFYLHPDSVLENLPMPDEGG